MLNKDLDRFFFEQDAITLAKNLLNKIIIINNNGAEMRVKIVETEAYTEYDRASASYKNIKNEENDAMFLEGGHIYVYKIYGRYHCLSIVNNKKDKGQAVLIRAVEPLNNFEIIKTRRKSAQKFISTTNGPGKLCQALKINVNYSKLDLLNNKYLKIIANNIVFDQFNIISKTITYDILKATNQNLEIIACRRIGISYAKQDQHLKWRFYIKDNLFVSYQLKL